MEIRVLNFLFLKFIFKAFYRWCHLKLLKHSSRSECAHSSHFLESIEITIKALDPFSSLVPLATNIKHAVEGQQDNNYLGVWGSTLSFCALLHCCPACSPACVASADCSGPAPGSALGCQAGIHTQLLLSPSSHPVVIRLAQAPLLRAACTVYPSPRVFWLQFLSTYPNASDLSHLLRPFQSWIPPLLTLSAGTSGPQSLYLLIQKDGSAHLGFCSRKPEGCGWELGPLAPSPVGPQQAARRTSCPQLCSRPALDNTLTESLLCPLGIVSQKSLMSELCIWEGPESRKRKANQVDTIVLQKESPGYNCNSFLKSSFFFYNRNNNTVNEISGEVFCPLPPQKVIVTVSRGLRAVLLFSLGFLKNHW